MSKMKPLKNLCDKQEPSFVSQTPYLLHYPNLKHDIAVMTNTFLIELSSGTDSTAVPPTGTLGTLSLGILL